MADLSQLHAAIDEYDFLIPLGRKKIKLKPSTHQVLDLKLKLNNTKGFPDQPTVFEMTAPFLGATFDPETYRFAPLGDGGEHDGLLIQLLDAGLDFSGLDLLLTAIFAKYQFGDDTAEALIETGDLGKALISVREKNEAKAKKATQPVHGETNVDG